MKKATAPHASRVFHIAIDGTYRSFHAYELTMAIMKPRDKVVVFSVFDPDDQGLAADIKHDTIEVRCDLHSVQFGAHSPLGLATATRHLRARTPRGPTGSGSV